MTMDGGSSFSAMGTALCERVSELKRLALLRVDDGAKGLFQQDLAGLEASVRAVESQVAALKECIAQEMSAMPKVEALIEASRVQSEHLQAIAGNLPARLPRATASTSVSGVVAAAGRGLGGGAAFAPAPLAAQAGPTGVDRAQEDASRKRAAARDVPRCYVTEAELASVSSYMRGRLQLDKVNMALDELANHALANKQLLAAAKAGGAKLTPAERKRATELLHSIAPKEGVKGCYWLLESDLREGQAVKLDKSGKALLTLLRHLGRVQEVRCNVDGAAVLVLVLVEDGRRPA